MTSFEKAGLQRDEDFKAVQIEEVKQGLFRVTGETYGGDIVEDREVPRFSLNWVVQDIAKRIIKEAKFREVRFNSINAKWARMGYIHKDKSQG